MNFSWCLSSLKKGSPHYPSFEINLFKAAMHPMSFCTSLMQVGAFILVMAEIFSGLASMPRWVMMKPSSFLEGTPKTHLFGLSFHWYSSGDAKVFQISDERVGVSGLDDLSST
jgi:hypothetical protein